MPAQMTPATTAHTQAGARTSPASHVVPHRGLIRSG
jgi:hypothetical protein